MSGIFDTTLNGLSRALDLRLQQHGLVSSNLANANTPQYEAKRIDFKAAFDQVFNQGDGSAMRTSSARHMVGGPDGGAPVETISAPAWSEDGNSVNPDHEMATLSENNILYNATIDAMTRKLALLEYAASDGGK